MEGIRQQSVMRIRNGDVDFFTIGNKGGVERKEEDCITKTTLLSNKGMA